MVPGLGLWLCLVLCVACAKFVPVCKLLWDDSCAGEEP